MLGRTEPDHSPAIAPATLMIAKQTIRSAWVNACFGKKRRSTMFSSKSASSPEIGLNHQGKRCRTS